MLGGARLSPRELCTRYSLFDCIRLVLGLIYAVERAVLALFSRKCITNSPTQLHLYIFKFGHVSAIWEVSSETTRLADVWSKALEMSLFLKCISKS